MENDPDHCDLLIIFFHVWILVNSYRKIWLWGCLWNPSSGISILQYQFYVDSNVEFWEHNAVIQKVKLR